MKTRRFIIVFIVLIIVGLGAAYFFSRGNGGAQAGGPGAPGAPGGAGAPSGMPGGAPSGAPDGAGGPGGMPRMSPQEMSLMQSLTAEQQKDVMARYSAAKADGKDVRLADFMPENTYSVKAAAARIGTVQSYIDVNGDVTTKTNVEVYPDIGGKLTELRVGLGDHVAKDQVIAMVDPSKPGSNYAASSVAAPITGTVTQINVSKGSTVGTGTVIAKVGILDEIEVHAQIRERDIAAVKAGQKAKVGFEAFAGETFWTTISYVSPVVDTVSRTLEIILTFSAKDTRILPGMYARVRLYTEAHVNKVTIPLSAIIERYGKYYVYVISRKETVDRVELREISRGLTVDDVVEILSGVKAGESVVASGQSPLSDNALVRIVSTEGGAQ
jgi:membrane fusion protein (multidrug efflux system)